MSKRGIEKKRDGEITLWLASAASSPGHFFAGFALVGLSLVIDLVPCPDGLGPFLVFEKTDAHVDNANLKHLA